MFTAGFSLVAMSSVTILKLLINPVLIGMVLVAYITSICALICCKMDKKVPVNYILLAIFTFCMSWIVGIACAASDPITVFEAAALTGAVVIAITIFAFKTDQDFTVCGPIVYIIFMLFFVGSLLAIFMGPTMRLLFCILGVFLFSFYLIIDT